MVFGGLLVIFIKSIIYFLILYFCNVILIFINPDFVEIDTFSLFLLILTFTIFKFILIDS